MQLEQTLMTLPGVSETPSSGEEVVMCHFANKPQYTCTMLLCRRCDSAAPWYHHRHRSLYVFAGMPQCDIIEWDTLLDSSNIEPDDWVTCQK